MTRGVVIFAYNNHKIDYQRLASWSAENIHRHLDLPVCLITDQTVNDSRFDKIIVDPQSSTDQRYFSDLDTTVNWRNHNRPSVYDLTPWDHTLVLDADYVVASDRLAALFDQDNDFLCHRKAIDVATGQILAPHDSFGAYRMPMWWATVMLFRRTTAVQHLFSMMMMVRDNWQHYRDLYHIERSVYRNDYALSIAQGVISGHTLQTTDIPWQLLTIMPHALLQRTAKDRYRIEYQTMDQKTRYLVLENQDFHAMGKQALGDIVANQS